jgi:hypothetical protein
MNSRSTLRATAALTGSTADPPGLATRLGAPVATGKGSVLKQSLHGNGRGARFVEDAGSVLDYADDPTKETLLIVARELLRYLFSAPSGTSMSPTT